jgi:hypothetical protein
MKSQCGNGLAERRPTCTSSDAGLRELGLAIALTAARDLEIVDLRRERRVKPGEEKLLAAARRLQRAIREGRSEDSARASLLHHALNLEEEA